MRRDTVSFVFIVLMFGLCMVPAAYGQAQLNRGVVEGTVTDPQGAAVPGVHITITDVETDVSAATKSDSAGYYRVPDLVPGRYIVRFELKGFASLDETGIEILPGEVRQINVALKVGTVHQTIHVSAQAAGLQTAPTNANTTLTTQSIQQIPLAGQNLQQLIFLMPNTRSIIGPPGTTFGFNSEYGSFPDPMNVQGSDVSVNGGAGGNNAWYLDGNYDVVGFADNMAVNPSPDAVEEFQAIDNSFSAQYSGTGGGVFSVVLKSGANQLHGDIYEYLENSGLEARNPFTSISSTGQLVAVPALRYNDFGGTLGGPVVLPHIYNGKDKTFFFFSWGSSILHESGNQVFSVPTPAEKNGDFSEDPDTSEYGLWDPFSTSGPNAQGVFDKTAFGTPAAGNPNGCLASQINASSGTSCHFSTSLPADRLDSTAMDFISSFPNPNYLDPLSRAPLANGDQYRIADNYLGGVGNAQDTDNISIKVDERASEKSSYFVDWLFNPTSYTFFREPWTGLTFPQPEIGYNGAYPFNNTNQVIGLGNTYTASPTLVNEFRASYVRQFLTTHPNQPFSNSIADYSQFQALMKASQIPDGQGYPAPNFTVSGPGGASYEWGPVPYYSGIDMAEAYTFLDNVTKISGKHTVTTGIMYQLQHTGGQHGYDTTLTFNNSANAVTGLGGGGSLEGFELGAVAANTTGYQLGLYAPSYQSSNTWGTYLQDEYHATHSLTLTLGLRYDVFGWYKDRLPSNTLFCYTCSNPADGGLPGTFEYTLGSQPIASPSYKDVGPRFNIAWSPDSRTVVRAGYDVFYSNAGEMQEAPGMGGGGAEAGWEASNTWEGSWNPSQCAPLSNECVAFPLDNTTVNKGALATPAYTTEYPGEQKSQMFGEGGINPGGRTGSPADPMIQMWNFQVQRELPGGLMLTVGYTGDHGDHLFGGLFQRENYVPTSDLLKYKDQIFSSAPITEFYSGQAAQSLEQIWGSSTLPLTTLFTPYPAWGQLNPLEPLDGASDYNALDIKLEERASHGLNYGVVYTNSKLIDNCCVGQMGAFDLDSVHGYSTVGGATNVIGNVRGDLYQNPDDMAADKSLDRYDMPQVLDVFGSYALPFGVGRSFLNRNNVLNQVVGGWRLTGNFEANSGTPLPISCPTDTLQQYEASNGDDSQRCNLIGNPHFSGSRSTQQQIADWINPSAFEPAFGDNPSVWSNYNPTASYAWQWGDMGPVLSNMRSPGFWNLDVSLDKDFHVTESKYFELRGEAFNALNHMNLGYPNTNFCLPPGPNGQTNLVQQAGCSFGQITNIQNDPRTFQFVLKFIW
jgi:Carboxypeptidase regulatory-like domain/TonB dependent receptor